MRLVLPLPFRPGVVAMNHRLVAAVKAADQLFRLLLQPDANGTPQALARRMGVQELIWDCGSWGAGTSTFEPYRPCYTKRGKLGRNVNKTTAHRDHIHIGMSKPGAKAQTSFWTS